MEGFWERVARKQRRGLSFFGAGEDDGGMDWIEDGWVE
jgi:hypothetical protein